MKQPKREDLLDLLVCDISARPAGAPMPADLAPHIRSLKRSDGALTVVFSPEAAAGVFCFAEAESRCCSSIGWRVETAPEVRLVITATARQLAAIEELFTPA